MVLAVAVARYMCIIFNDSKGTDDHTAGVGRATKY